MPTPISANAPYCTPAQLLQFHDAKQIGDALNDGGIRLTASLIPMDPNVAAALSWASGMVESACFVANKYSVTDLQSLTGQAAVLLQGLVADLAFWKMKNRRGGSSGQKMQPTPDELLAWKMLDDLREGNRLFGLQDQMNAGNPEVYTTNIGDLQTLNLTTLQAGRFFGVRADELKALGGPGVPAVSQ